MAYISGGQGGDSSLVVFPVDHMRNVAAQILVQAGNAQMQHDTQWQQLQTTILNNFDPSIQQTVLDCLKAYADHLRVSYDWQMSLASALFDAVDAIEQTDQHVSQSYQSGRGYRA